MFCTHQLGKHPDTRLRECLAEGESQRRCVLRQRLYRLADGGVFGQLQRQLLRLTGQGMKKINAHEG